MRFRLAIANCFAPTGLLAIVLLALSPGASPAQYQAGQLPAPGGSPGGLHRIHSADSPPGALGMARLQRWGAVGGYYQPVAFHGPRSTAFSMVIDGRFGPAVAPPATLRAGLLIGQVYRFKITSIPGYEGEELFPTVELIDRTYPPHHLAARHPIPIVFEQDDLVDALAGRMVTRVIYLEDPTAAVPLEQTPETSRALDIPADQDPLGVADSLGRAVAIVRLGSVAPPTQPALLPQFFFGFPPWVHIPAEAVQQDRPDAVTATSFQDSGAGQARRR